MKKILKGFLNALLVLALVISIILPHLDVTLAAENNGGMSVGVARTDITGPIIDISTGYNSMGDLMEGLLTRLYSRAFVIDDGNEPFVFVSVELVHMTESIKPGVIAKLKEDGYGCFTEENVMLTATHCHSSTSNTSWYALYDLINGVSGYDDESYKVIVKRVAESIEQAYDSRVSGSASLVYANTDISASNRSADAFLTNIDASDYGYSINEDGTFSYSTGLSAAKNAYNHEMAGIILTDDSGKDIGFYNFFASHGTSNDINNVYVASDHKGYAALKVEEEMGDGFVAAFAQADSGDTSPNAIDESDYHNAFLRPAETDSSLDVIENQIVYGNQEADAALKLLKSSDRIKFTGDIDFNYTVVDFSDITVDLKYVGDYYMPYDDLSAGYVTTSEPCIGAGIIAGDEEGAPVDNAVEGSVKHDFVWNDETQSYEKVEYDFSTIDLSGLENVMGPLWPAAMKILDSDEYDEEQMEKVVCLAVGKYMQKAQPLQVVRIGSVAIASVPFELTYAQGCRIREILQNTLADAGVTKIIVATHANAYSQYVTTREEYAAQHYEGSTCLFGPWSGAALTQELDKLASGIVNGTKADKSAELTQTEPSGLLYTTMAAVTPSIDVGIFCTLEKDIAKKTYSKGETVSAVFTGANPRHITDLILLDSDLVDDYSYIEIQKKVDGKWVTYLDDSDPYTTFHVHRAAIGFDMTAGWLIKGDTYSSGTYRIVYNGIYKYRALKGYKYKLKVAKSSEFTVE